MDLHCSSALDSEEDIFKPKRSNKSTDTITKSGEEISKGNNCDINNSSDSEEDIFKKKPRHSRSLKKLTEEVNRKKTICTFCKKNISAKNIRRHARNCGHYQEYKCNVCHVIYSRKDVLQNHATICSKKAIGKIPCSYRNCTALFPKKMMLIDHLKVIHKVDVKDPILLSFSNIDEFDAWKDEEEKKNIFLLLPALWTKKRY